MERAQCYNCGSDQHSYYAEENGFVLVKCSGCGLLFVEKPPSNESITQAHRQGVHRGTGALDVTGHYDAAKVPFYLEVLRDMFGELREPRSWLDVGCGHGEFMTALEVFGQGRIQATGSEPNDRKREAARARSLNVSYFDLESHSATYDVISLLNVYSHLPDPPALIASFARLLNPGGELLIETGDTAHFSAADHFRPFYLPDHLSFASEEIVRGILDRAGYDIVNVHKYPLVKPTVRRIGKELAKLII